MSIKFIGLLIFLLNFSLSFAQTQGEDLIKLKNGKEVRGIIVEQHPGLFIKVLQIPSSDTVKIDSKQIQTIIKIIDNSNETVLNIDTLKLEKEITDTVLIDTTDAVLFNQRLFQIHLILSKVQGDYGGVGYGISAYRSPFPYLKIGLGFNYFRAYINAPYQKRESIALFTEVCRDISVSKKGRFGFVSGLGLGYNIDFSDPYWDLEALQNVTISNGIYVNPHVGLRMNFTENSGIIGDVGYQYIRSNVKKQINDEKLEGRNLSSFMLKISLFF